MPDSLNHLTAYTLSRRAAAMERSVMRELLKHAVNPDVISLAGGLPAPENLPTAQLQTCLNDVLKRDNGAALQYSPPYEPLRQWIADDMTARGVRCTPADIFITNGNQQGLSLLAQLFVDVGDTVVIEEAIFTGIQQSLQGAGTEILTIPTDLDSGADIDALEAHLQAADVKLVVLVPDFHNPLGVTLSDVKRQRVARLAAEYQVPVIEDDAYSRLRFTGEDLPPIQVYDSSGYVFYMGSFSKMLAPGLRMGWLVIPPELQPAVTVLRESIDLETSTLLQRATGDFLQRGYLETHLEQLNASHQRRADALMQALTTHLGDIATWTTPEGGLFSWCVLPESLDTWVLLDDAIEAGVVYIPGGAFAVDGGKRHTMRLNFSNVAPEQFDDGLRRLRRVIDNHLS